MDANEVAAHERFYGRVLGAVNKLIGDLWRQDGLTPADFGRIAARALKEAAARADQGNSEWPVPEALSEVIPPKRFAPPELREASKP